MKYVFKKRWLILSMVLLLLVACGGSNAPSEEVTEDGTVVEENAEVNEEAEEEEPVSGAVVEENADEASAVAEPSERDAEMSDDTDGAIETAASAEWLTYVLQDARTGDAFTLGDFAGRPVYVEPMATWCTNCRRQLNTLSAGLDQLPEDAVVIGLSVEQNLRNEVLAGYANDQGYDFLFAVATPELIEALVAEYGRTVANPPATPHFIIRPDQTVSELYTGQHAIEDIVMQIEQAGQ